MLSNVHVEAAFRQLALDVKKIINDRIRTYGVNPKTGRNTLEGSNLQRTMGVYPTENGIELHIADYWEFISRGWERTGNYPNTMSQWVKNVDDWVSKNNIRFGDMTQSQIVFVIIRNIINHGLKSRPFLVWNDDGDLEKMIPELNEYLDKWFDTLFNAIFADIDAYFNS